MPQVYKSVPSSRETCTGGWWRGGTHAHFTLVAPFAVHTTQCTVLLPQFTDTEVASKSALMQTATDDPPIDSPSSPCSPAVPCAGSLIRTLGSITPQGHASLWLGWNGAMKRFFFSFFWRALGKASSQSLPPRPVRAAGKDCASARLLIYRAYSHSQARLSLCSWQNRISLGSH